ncbi:MAG: permease prefix domain 1-containing protein [Mycetocola sp.]
MSASTLTDRYVAAALRTVPEAQRTDLGAELRASIDDQIDARAGGGMPAEAAERAVLTELGDPDKLAAEYTDRPLHLIGPKYYLDWWRLMKLLLWIVLPCAAFGVALAQVLAGAGIGEVIGTVVVTLLTVTVHLFFWVTLVFFMVERTGTPIGTKWTIEQLPEPRERGLGFGDMVASLVFLALAAGAIVWDHFIGFVPTHPGLSFFDDGLWPWMIAILFAIMALDGALSVTVYLVRRWTVPLAVTNAVLALAVAIPAIVLLVQGELLTPGFWSTVIPDAASGRTVQSIMTVITGFVIAGAALWDIIDVAIKTVRAR